MTFSLINKNLPDASFEALKWGLSARLEKRNAALSDSGDAVISVAVVPSMDADSYKIYADGDVTCIEADRICNVFAAIGRYFVKGKFDHKGGFSAPTLPIVHKMNKPFRGLYYFSHFYNIYHVAPVEVIYDKIIDLAFYGCNCLSLTFGVQHYTSVKEPEAAEFVGRMRKMLEFADVCGLAPGLILYANSGMKDTYYGIEAQKDLDDSGRYTRALIAEFNTEICPNVPGGMEEIERQKRELLEAFVGVPIKYFTLWAYDESGCLCEKCYPWVTNGYMKIADLTRKLIKEYGFDAELMISTWHFDVKKADEWEIFYEGLKNGEYSWSPDILTSFRSGEVHKVIAENGVPEGVRLIDFTEISMCGAKPWGGFGANPITLHIENLFRNCGDYYSGCFPYSEGIYEDINKWVCFGPLHAQRGRGS